MFTLYKQYKINTALTYMDYKWNVGNLLNVPHKIYQLVYTCICASYIISRGIVPNMLLSKIITMSERTK